MFILFLISEIHVVRAENNACSRLYDYPIKDTSKDCYVNPNVMALTPAIIVESGYNFESYEVRTPDGYDLQLFRIPPNEGDYRVHQQPVLLEHGLFHDSSSWLLVGNRSMAFNLADRGYDVWLANQRQTRYSERNTTMQYWNFSMDAIAANDIPTFLTLISEVTEKPGSTIYIGHSRGTTLVFMYASEYPERAQELLSGIIALCPVVYFDMVWYMKRAISMVPGLAVRISLSIVVIADLVLQKTLLSRQLPVIFYNMDVVFSFLYKFCSQFPFVCRFWIDLTSGATWQFLPRDLLVVCTHSPSTEGVVAILHYVQIALSGRFQKYDYGKADNLQKYGQEEPPLYNLTNIRVPVFMFYGENDVFIKAASVKRVFNEIGSSRKAFWKIPIGVEEWEYQLSHNDFLWAEHLEKFLYSKLFDLMETQLLV